MKPARLLAALLALALLPSLARAQQDVIKLAERLNKKAMEDYDALEFDSARQTLLSAIAKLRDAGQDETPTAAKIYMNLGVVYIAGFKDKNRGIQQFVNALKIDGTAALDPERATPELQEAFDQAQKQAGGGGTVRKPPRGGGDNNPPPSTVKGLQHTAIDEAAAGQDVQVKAQLGSDVAASRLFLFYRTGGQEDYVSVPMQRSGGDWVGLIPGEAMEGKAVQYYIEARDARGRPVIGAGNAASPYIISVTETKGPSQTDVDVENPLEGIKKRKRGADEEPKTTGRGFGRMFFTLGAGVGIGIQPAGNVTEVAYLFQAQSGGYVPQPIGQTGLAFSPLHATLEIGVNITRHIALSAQARAGFTLVNNADSSEAPPLGAGVRKAQNDFAGLLRFTYRFGEGKVKPMVHAGIGGGTLRHVLDVTSANTDPDHPLSDQVTADFYASQGKTPSTSHGDLINPVCPADGTSCIDTIAIGYMFFALGGGLFVDLVTFHNGGFGLLFDVDMLLGLPIANGQFGVNFDINLGIGAHFL